MPGRQREARIEPPAGRGLWPAFWMLPVRPAEVAWPHSGELDVVETFGSEPGRLSGTLHGPGDFGRDGVGGATEPPGGLEGSHVFAVEWEPGGPG